MFNKHFNETDYLKPNDINYLIIALQEIFNKYSDILQKKYTPDRLVAYDDLIYIQDLKYIEDNVEYVGNMFGYPTGWETSKDWGSYTYESISNRDLNRLYNNINILYNTEFKPLLPKHTLKPRDSYIYPNTSEYPKKDLYSNPLIPSNNTKESD